MMSRMDLPVQVAVTAGHYLKLALALGGSMPNPGIVGASLQPVPVMIRAVRDLGPVNTARTAWRHARR